jgi:hypothetical protein
MYPSRGYRWLSKPGACARLISALSARQDEHAADWLASGQGIALMRVVTMDALQHIVTVEPVRVLTGTPAPMPRYVRWLAQNCPTTPVLNGELLLPIYGTPVDTMTVKACMGPLRVGAGMRSTPYGVALDRIGDVVQSTPHGMRLERLHGVPLNCEPRH